jgi:hypothetical protein
LSLNKTKYDIQQTPSSGGYRLFNKKKTSNNNKTVSLLFIYL